MDRWMNPSAPILSTHPCMHPYTCMYAHTHVPTYTHAPTPHPPPHMHSPTHPCTYLFQNKLLKSCASCGFGQCLSNLGPPAPLISLQGGTVWMLSPKSCSPLYSSLTAARWPQGYDFILLSLCFLNL